MTDGKRDFKFLEFIVEETVGKQLDDIVMKRRATDADIQNFLAAVYPLGPARAAVVFDEHLVEATRLITEFREASRAVLDAFDAGVFVRSIEHDADPAWGIRLLPHLLALKRLKDAVGA